MSANLVLPARLWPAPEPAPVGPPRQLLLVLGVGVLGAFTLHVEVLGLGAFVTGASVLALALTARGTRPRAQQLLPATAAAMLLAVAALRGADWLVGLCLLGAWGLASLALVGGRTWTGVLLSGCAAALVPLRALRWFASPVSAMALPRRGIVVAALSVGLLVVFGVLLGTADPAYGHLLEVLLPSARPDVVVQRCFLLLGTAGVAGLAVYLAQRPPAVDALAPGPATPARRGEWLVPLAAVDGLFLSFVVVQLTVLFGSREHVLRTTGLTYAEYARHGFWQLLVVTGLTLAVIAIAVRVAPRVSSRDRLVVRVMLGALCLLSLVIVASALHRMSLYQAEYGWTQLRLLVSAVELALGAVFLVLLAAGVRLDGRALPRAVVGVATVTLLGLAALDPDAWIARHDVARYQSTGDIDTSYLSGLSADAVPELLRLPEPLRSCAVEPIARRLEELPHPWYDDNLARACARAALARADLSGCR
jgi:hypothetical protein